MAVWYYVPSEIDRDERHFCDNCVQRGCSCNIDPYTGEDMLDELGRLQPCCEYDFSEEGFDYN